MKITSVNNQLIKDTAKLQERKYRDETGSFLLEGDKCIEEALASGIEIKHLFVLEGYNFLDGMEKFEVTEAILSKVSSTKTAPRTVAVAKKPKYKWSKNLKKVVLLEDIKDAGNLGTILRSACAFNADAIVLYGDTVDLYNPKCVRASVGNLWKIPVFEIKDFFTLQEYFKEYERIATLPKSNKTVLLKDYKPQDKVLIMFGTESSGLSYELTDFANKNITIEMSNKVESLNLSVSVAVVLYQLF